MNVISAIMIYDNHAGQAPARPRFEPVLLRSFIAVVEARSFTRAARHLGLRQSTVSQHVARLEALAGRRLIARDTHRVSPTPDGDALLDFARRLLEAEARIDAYFAASALRGRIRIGASEDFVFSALPEVLADFAGRHPEVDLELTVGLSQTLYAGFDAGELDLIFAKRRAGDRRGRVAWAEELVWIARPGKRPVAGQPVPLVLYPPPSVTRERALEAMDRAHLPWRIACSSGSLSGLRAAALAGLGFAAHAARLIPPGLAPVPLDAGLPPLGLTEFVVIGPEGRHPAAALAEALLSASDRIRSAGITPGSG